MRQTESRYDQSMLNTPNRERLVLLLPVFNDWEPAGMLLRQLDTALAGCPYEVEVLMVDDGSTEPLPPHFLAESPRNIRSVEVLHLRTNLGHQRAIAVGLVFVCQNRPCAAVAIMDADGQDRAEDLPRLIERFRSIGGDSIVFAERTKRLESWSFQFLYHTYRRLHRILTGDPVRVGNFSVVPYARLRQLTVISDIWNHYAAAVIRSRIRFQTAPIPRGERLAGRPQMNFTRLLLHALSAFFVYGDVIGARLLAGTGVLLVSALAILAGAVGLALATRWRMPEWAPYAAAFWAILLLQAILISLVLVFIVVGSRVNARFVPLRDCPGFEDGVETVFDEPKGTTDPGAAGPPAPPAQ
jgi:polyisoprenyl-phosphate glycosyltransferase